MRRLSQVSFAPPWQARLSWSPDGKNLALHEWSPGGTSGGILLLSVDTREKRRLTSRYDRYAAFSPDGRRLAFFRGRGFNPGLMVIPAAGGEPVRLVQAGGLTRGLAWTPDGREIVFAAGGRLWEIPAAGGNPQLLAFAGSGAPFPAVSRAGGRLAFARRIRDIDIWRVDAHAPDTPPVKLVPSTLTDANPQFSPDGRRIAFTSRRSGELAIWVADADGSNLLRVTQEPVGGTPRWSPDGRAIVYDGPAEGASDIFLVSSSGGPVRSITTEASADVVASFSRDGRWIYFASDRSEEFQVWKIPVEGESKLPGSAVQVTRNGGFGAFESPDGKYVYYAKARGSQSQNFRNAIWRVPVAGGREEPVVEPVFSNWGNWAVLDEGLYFVNSKGEDESPEGRWAVFLYRFDDASISEVAPLSRPPYVEGPGFDILPGGRWILYAAAGPGESDLMLVENFR